jgi:hypothetical protein
MKFMYEKEGRYVCECESCGMQIKIKKSEIKKQGSIGIVEEIECFCGEVSDQIKDIPIEKGSQVIVQTVDRAPQTGVPHCPTCGSTNVERISIGSKAVGAYMFGVFSSNIRNTYRCKNCKYKW